MKSFIALVALLVASSAQAVDLKYDCEGLFSGPVAIGKAKATIEGSFNGGKKVINVVVELNSGAVLTGEFKQESSGALMTGVLALKDSDFKYPGHFERVALLGNSDQQGFRFKSNTNSLLLTCVRN